MFRLLQLMLGLSIRVFCSRSNLLMENLVLRQQLSVLKRRHRSPKLPAVDKLFLVAVQKFWTGWKRSLILVSPETVVRWHRAGFRLYWFCLSRHRIRTGRKQISKELRELIFRMVAENPTWGASRIHGELQMLGFDVSERTVSRWVQQAPKDSGQRNRWKAFLQNHREVIAASIGRITKPAARVPATAPAVFTQ